MQHNKIHIRKRLCKYVWTIKINKENLNYNLSLLVTIITVPDPINPIDKINKIDKTKLPTTNLTKTKSNKHQYNNSLTLNYNSNLSSSINHMYLLFIKMFNPNLIPNNKYLFINIKNYLLSLLNSILTLCLIHPLPKLVKLSYSIFISNMFIKIINKAILTINPFQSLSKLFPCVLTNA